MIQETSDQPTRTPRYWFWVWIAEITVPKASMHDPEAKGERWQNLILVSSDTAQGAIDRAMALGKAEAGDCQGSLTLDGEPAVTIFLGIEDMGLVHEPIEDGAEILFRSTRPRISSARRRIRDSAALLKQLDKELAPYLRLDRS